MNSHLRLRQGAVVLGGAPLLLLAGVPSWLVLALGVAGALLVLSALSPGRRGGSGPGR
ncbi:MAG TPA: hypothetical protein VHF89_03630 [Solirubrobacteraceae bacterium]|nr:hypothetical protein [Solirubrobacteraceae bacterium]